LSERNETKRTRHDGLAFHVKHAIRRFGSFLVHDPEFEGRSRSLSEGSETKRSPVAFHVKRRFVSWLRSSLNDPVDEVLAVIERASEKRRSPAVIDSRFT
jgi:hypothetical protein